MHYGAGITQAMGLTIFRKVAVSALLLGVSAGWAVNANAMSLREYKALQKTGKEGANYANYYVVGVMEGILHMQVQMVRLGAVATICINGRRMQPSAARELLATELKRNADLYEADMPVELVLSNALANVYPCD
jgi:hypothetical protein